MPRPLPAIPVKIIKPGDEVFYNGWPYKVKYTQISRKGLMVYLDGINEPVPEHKIDVDPIIIDFEKARKKRNGDA